MNKEEASRQVQELFRGTSTLVSVEPGCAHIDGAVTATQLRHLAFIVEAWEHPEYRGKSYHEKRHLTLLAALSTPSPTGGKVLR